MASSPIFPIGLSAPTTVRFLNSQPGFDDPLYGQFLFSGNGKLSVQGTLNPIFSGTDLVTTSRNQLVGTPWTISAASSPAWTIDTAIQDAAGSLAWIFKISGSVSNPCAPLNPSGAFAIPAMTNLINGAYSVVQPTSIVFGGLVAQAVGGAGTQNENTIEFVNLAFERNLIGTGFSEHVPLLSSVSVYFKQCRFHQLIRSLCYGIDGICYLNCDLAETPNNLGRIQVLAGRSYTGPFNRGDLAIFDGLVIQGSVSSDLDPTSDSRIGDVGVFDSNDALEISGSVIVKVIPFYYGTAAIWGNASKCVNIHGEGKVIYSGDPTLIFLNQSTFVLGGQTNGFAFDRTAAAYVGPRANTWANLKATISSGGFGGTAMDPPTGTIIEASS